MKMNKQEKLEWYQEEFGRISKDISEKNSLSYQDFLRIRNFKIQSSTIEKEEKVKKITNTAFKLAKEDKKKEAINELRKLYGVAIPIASTILAMRYPNRYAIIDKRVLKALGKEKWIRGNKYMREPQIYEDYLILMKKKKPSNVTLRDYERNLYESQSRFKNL